MANAAPGLDFPELALDSLHPSLTDPSLRSMNLLNQIANEYPDAISFAAGRPYEGFYDVENVHTHLRVFCAYLRDERGMDEAAVTRTVFQYGPTKGIITDLVARTLAEDEGISADPESIVMTVGCQEAMFLVLRALRADERDVVLAPQPAYVGLTGAARLVDMPVWPVPTDASGLDLDALVNEIELARSAGKRVRACYVTPDFANPVGVSMDVSARRQLLDIAAHENILLLEDNAYGLFHDGAKLPTLKALDRTGSVVYLGSFAKTAMPGARVGYVVASQRIPGPDATNSLFADELSKIKSMLTVNTAPLAQAVIGGKLITHGYSLTSANKRETTLYQRNLRQVQDELDRLFGDLPGVHWNRPTGGFFITVTVPFPVDDQLLAKAAREYGVLFTPMCHFYGGDGGHHQLRLSVSVLTPELIAEGMCRLSALITDQATAQH